MDENANANAARPAAAAGEDPAVGRVISDRYRLLGRVGEGGMGLVYRAEHILMKKTVAIKLLHGELGQVGEAVKRFEREAQSASRLNHPNIIGVTDFGQAATGEFFLVMEYVAGRSLGQALAAEPGGRMSVARALGIVRQMLSALSHAHASGVIHRDLKPANVMLTRATDPRRGEPGSADTVKILDFGIAKMSQITQVATHAATVSSADPTLVGEGLTQSTMVFGTPTYMSPEQATAQEVDARADLYSCGIILFELLTGRKPFIAHELGQILAMQVAMPPPRFVDVAPDARIPAALEEVVRRALEKDRARRFQSAAAFLTALESLETAVVPQAIAALAISRGKLAFARGRVLWAETRALYRRLPLEFRRFSPIAGVLGVILVLVIVPSICYRAANLSTTPTPKPPAAELERPLAKVADAVAAGRLTEARAMLLDLVSKHPNEGRVHFARGNLEYVEKKFPAAIEAYRAAIEADPSLRGDAALMLNLRALVGDRDKKVAQAALVLIGDRVGKPGEATLVEVAGTDARPEMRAIAREACDKVGCTGRIDLIGSYSQDLAQAKTCDDKREAVRRLGAIRDPRAVQALKRARGVRGALGGLFAGGNDCVRKEIDAALKELEGV